MSWAAWLAALGAAVIFALVSDVESERLAEGTQQSAAQRGEGARVPQTSAFFSRAACEAQLPALSRKRTRPRGPRIGTWNVRWFPQGASKAGAGTPTDVAWLACAIASLDVDVLAVQEFLLNPAGRSALLELRGRLDELTGGQWRDAFDDCRGDAQHVGFLFDAKRVELLPARPVAELNPGRNACDLRLRPGLSGYARFASGPDLQLLTVHFDAGMLQRDFTNRRKSTAALQRVASQLASEHEDHDLLLLGDFNTMGCDSCVPRVSASDEIALLDAQLEPLALSRLALRAEHACTHYYRGNAGALDHLVANAKLGELPTGARVEAHGPCRDLGCKSPATGENVRAWRELSDHCPLVIELAAEDRD